MLMSTSRIGFCPKSIIASGYVVLPLILTITQLLEAKFALRHLAGAGAPGGPRGMARALRDRVLSG